MKAAFADYLASEEGGAVKAIFVGTRRTDPHGGGLGFFDPTDHGWPKFLRCHPVIDWHYREIWGVSVFFLFPPESLRYGEGGRSLIVIVFGGTFEGREERVSRMLQRE